MKKNRKYTSAPKDVSVALTEGEVVSWDKIEQMIEMPTVSNLASGLRTKKTSISLTEFSINKFKDAAEQEHVPYQQLIREVLQWYAQHYLGSDRAKT